DDDEDAHSENKEELTKTEEATADDVLDELLNMPISKDAENDSADKPAPSDPLIIFKLILIHFLPK
ncbi:hypothetical protein Tco_0563185, partial [Tanacetum coccineum]